MGRHHRCAPARLGVGIRVGKISRQSTAGAPPLLHYVVLLWHVQCTARAPPLALHVVFRNVQLGQISSRGQRATRTTALERVLLWYIRHRWRAARTTTLLLALRMSRPEILGC